MASVNKVIVLGNLGKDPEVRYTQGGDPVCNFSMATTEKYKDKSGEQQERTEWHRVTAFGRTAEIVGEYLHKGSSCYVEGRLQTREYEKDGIKRYTTEIVVERLVLLGSPSGERRERTEERPSSNGQRKPPPKSQGDFDDSIPF